MIVTAKNLINSKFATSGAIEYTASGARAIIDKFTAFNSDGGTITLSIYIVPRTLSFGDSNAVMKIYSLTTGVTKDFTELQNQILEDGDAIYVAASTGAKVSIRCSGREVTA